MESGSRAFLEITSFVQHGKVVEVVGKTEPGSTVFVNNEQVLSIAADGSFRHFTAPLPKSGSNQVTITAQNRKGDTNTIRKAVVIESVTPADTQKEDSGARVYQVGKEVSAPVAIWKPNPPYTKEARKAKLEGTVKMEAVVDDHGNVGDVKEVSKPLGGKASMKALWKRSAPENSDLPCAMAFPCPWVSWLR